MAALEPGKNAPDFSLKTIAGGDFNLSAERKQTPVVTAFFKVECPTCQYAMPFIERIYRAYPQDKVKIVAVSQNDKSATDSFIKHYGLTMPVLLEETKKYATSNAYGLTNVPTFFMVSPEGKVTQSSVSWVKIEIESLNAAFAAAAGVPPAQVFKPGEQVAEYKAG
jgi:peroxiredoxin